MTFWERRWDLLFLLLFFLNPRLAAFGELFAEKQKTESLDLRKGTLKEAQLIPLFLD